MVAVGNDIFLNFPRYSELLQPELVRETLTQLLSYYIIWVSSKLLESSKFCDNILHISQYQITGEYNHPLIFFKYSVKLLLFTYAMTPRPC